MKICPKCNQQLDDNLAFCPVCGADLSQVQPTQQANQAYGAPMPVAPVLNPFDHTAEFDAKDISDNKVISMTVYLLSFIGIIIALLAANSSPYAAFHVRQGLKLIVVETLLLFCSLVLFWTVLIPIAGFICLIILGVVEIICFFQVCAGKAKEPAIIRNFGFLK